MKDKQSDESDWEWGVRYPGGETTIFADESKARALTDNHDALVLLLRPIDRMKWICATCDDYGVLDGLEPCPKHPVILPDSRTTEAPQ